MITLSNFTGQHKNSLEAFEAGSRPHRFVFHNLVEFDIQYPNGSREKWKIVEPIKSGKAFEFIHYVYKLVSTPSCHRDQEDSEKFTKSKRLWIVLV